MIKRTSVKNLILADVLNREPNSIIPSRNVLCRKYAISRGTVDKIIRELEDEGYLYSAVGSGTYVALRESGAAGKKKVDISDRMWAVLQYDVHESMQHACYVGINQFAEKYGYSLVMCHTKEDPETEAAYIDWLIRAGISGAIIVPARQDASCKTAYLKLKNAGIPFVFWNRPYDSMPEVPQVCYNGYHGGEMAVRHLIENGRKRISFLSKISFRSSKDRFFGYCSALNNAGISVDMSLVDMNLKEGLDGVRRMLTGSNPPDAFICHDEDDAKALMELTDELGLRVPDDVAVVAFENVVIRDERMESVTRVRINFAESGLKAAQILHSLCLDRNAHVPMLSVQEPSLLVRKTSVISK